jgi:hypothetical protein
MLRVYAYIHLKKSISRLILLKSLSLDFFPNVHENLIETVKRYSDVLENPLNELDDQIKEIEKLLGSEEFQSSEHRDILTNTLDTLREAQRGEWSDSFDVLEQARSNFYTHLERNSGSEIPTGLNKIYYSLEKYLEFDHSLLLQ